MFGQTLKTIAIALVGAASLASQPANAEDAEKRPDPESIKALLKEIREGDREKGMMDLGQMCIDYATPTKGNFACIAYNAEFEDDPQALLKMRQARCEIGDGGQCLGAYFMLEDQQAAPAQRLNMLQQSCIKASSDGCALLGYSMATGKHGTTDLDQSKAAFDLACTLGDQETCISFAGFMQKRLFGPVGDFDFVDLARRACPQPPAKIFKVMCVEAAEIIELHGTDEQIAANTRPMLAMACDEYADARSCEWLIEDYANGDSGPVDTAKSRYYRDRTCRIAPSSEGC